MTPPLNQGCVTHAGLVRPANEDSFLARPNDRFWLVADGMGGHKNGQWASRTVAEAAGAARLCGDFAVDIGVIQAALGAANRTIYGEARREGVQMGSTVVALLLGPERAAVFWTGDSRAYRLRAGVLDRLTRDHTQVREMIDAGYLTEEEGRDHPMAHVLSRAVGVEPALGLERRDEPLGAGDVFLLCSDGLTGVVSDAEIADRLAGAAPQVAVDRLLELTLARGAPDNVTLVAVACGSVDGAGVEADAATIGTLPLSEREAAALGAAGKASG